ncbi:polysaccharide biosynthesis tyrosine autokinase [Duganella sp. FT50W]|uniref:non-specific protein-tyrosine kinase n=1 Tax=Duganella lactea TaxID=2692173 RepID=A0A6L8MK18_9BURK|nr:polysaccharide biosynthesis tyrosine autokinase [Duganella lactea]MYM82939.1 polysaccharide biosynthesis tyrosine autokinase [Duganella lactea]
MKPSDSLTPVPPSAQPAHLHELEITLDFVEYWRSITKRKWSILAFGVMVAVLAAVAVFAMTPIYRSTVTLLIDANKSKVVSIDSVYGGFSDNRDYYMTQVEILKAPDVALKTITRMKLWENPEFDPREADGGLVNDALVAIGFADQRPKVWNEESLARAVLSKFNKRLTVEPIRLSLLVKVSFDAADRQLAADVANAMAATFIEADLDVHFQMTQKASAWLQDRTAGIRKKLDESERQLQAYRDQAGIVDVKSASQSGQGKQVEELTQRMVESRLRLAEAENAYNQIKSAPPGADLASLPAVVRNTVVGEALRQQAEAERKLSEIAQRYGHDHPKYVQADGEVKAARDNVKRQTDNVVASVTREYEVARGTLRTLEGALGQARGAIQNTNRKEFQLNVLEREVESNRQIYDMFVKRAKETSVAGDLENAVARVVDQAKTSGAPVKPKKGQIILIALALGLLGGVMASLLMDLLDNTLKSTADVETKLKQPLLTSLPLLSKKSADRTTTAHIFMDEPQSLYAESIRTALTSVMMSTIDLDRRVLLVTSSVPGEGKTTFSINLAMAHALTKRTLLIDADMRRPAIGKGLEISGNAAGLSALVAGTAPLEQCLRTVEGTSLSVITAGMSPLNPLEMLMSQRFQDTLAKLSQEFEVIVIDSPPVGLVSDALVLSKYATGVIYVAKAVDTPYQLARRGLLRLKRADGNILGVVLNCFDFKKAERYYGEYSAYGSGDYGKDGYGGYGVGYGTGDTKTSKNAA